MAAVASTSGIPSKDIEVKDDVACSVGTIPASPGYFFHSRPHIQAGDIVIVYMKRDFLQAITVTPGQFLHNKFGKYAHSDMVGVKFGSRITSPPPFQGFVHLLRPTPELWTLSLPHRTQIVYMPDISFIAEQLGVRTGGRVIEAGTGSGSMSHSLARTLRGVGGGGVGKGSEGKGKGVLYSYEYHATRFEKAKAEFFEHGLDDTIYLRHSNVCKEGFGDVGDGVDAVFLDLPAPWEAIPHAVKALRSDVLTKICCFSPCIEQVTRTVAALDAEGFTDIEMHEVLTRIHEIQTPQPSFSSVSSISSKLRRHAVRKEERRQSQIQAARARKLQALVKLKQEEEAAALGKEGIVSVAEAGAVEEPRKRGLEDGVADDEVENPKKRIKIADGTAASTPQGGKKPSAPSKPADQDVENEDDDDAVSSSDDGQDSSEPWSLGHDRFITKPIPEMRGHTSYLTFAVLYPASVREELASRPAANKQVRPVDVSGIASPAVTTDVTRAGSVDTEVSDGFARAIASMTEEELLGMS